MPAGRPSQFGQRKQPLTIRITPTLREFLDTREQSAAIVIEQAVRDSPEFQQWLSDHVSAADASTHNPPTR